MTIIEICRVTDKQASLYLEANKSQGLDIIKFNNTFYTYIKTEPVYRAKNTEFKSVSNGLYVFKE